MRPSLGLCIKFVAQKPILHRCQETLSQFQVLRLAVERSELGHGNQKYITIIAYHVVLLCNDNYKAFLEIIFNREETVAALRIAGVRSGRGYLDASRVSSNSNPARTYSPGRIVAKRENQ